MSEAAREDPNQLIRDAIEFGRDLDDRELDIITNHVAQAGYDDTAWERARGRLAGLVWNGRVLTGSDMLRPAEAHYLRHVVHTQQWPAGMDMQKYVQSLRDVIVDERSGLLVGLYQGAEQLTVIRRSIELRGAAGFEWTLVDYRVDTGHWVTAFQPGAGLATLQSSQRTNIRWLRHAQ